MLYLSAINTTTAGDGDSAVLFDETGSFFVELTFALPVFLLVVFIILWVGVVSSAKTSLVSALGTGVRLGYTRGVPGSGADNINVLNSYDSGPLPNVLYSGVDEETEAYPYYQSQTDCVFGQGAFCGFGSGSCLSGPSYPRTYLYALAITLESLKKSIGPGLRYPCSDPGCAECYPIAAPGIPQSCNQGFWDPDIFNPNFTGIACTYYPAGPLAAPISGLLRLLTGKGTGLFSISKFQTLSASNLSS